MAHSNGKRPRSGKRAKKKTAPRKKAATRKRSPYAGEAIPRRQLAAPLVRRIDADLRGSREVAAGLVNDAASQLSRLMNGHIGEFSAERLTKMLTRTGHDVDIIVRRRPRITARGRVRVILGRPRHA